MSPEKGFIEIFGRHPAVLADAGGRVNLIGEHTDYHGGFVFPAAIDLRCRVAAGPRGDRQVVVWSENLRGFATGRLDALEPRGTSHWSSYCLGPFWALREAGVEVQGADIWLNGEVPLGSGLSSSASIAVALVGVGAAMAGKELKPLEIARIAQLAENRFCGVPCGVMDQVASACVVSGHALLLDCRSLEVQAVPFPEEWAIGVIDSGVKHSVGSGEYARRQEQCAMGMEVLRRAYPGVMSARDVTMDMLDSVRGSMPEVSYRRLRHVVRENARTLLARAALEASDPSAMGRLLYESHESLARDYEVSCRELDLLVEAARATRGVIGGRLCGAGFGGNVVVLTLREAAEGAMAEILERYASSTGMRTASRLLRASDGLRVRWLS